MAHAHVSKYATAVTVEDNKGEIWIAVGDFLFRMEKEEAAQLAADLLNAAGVTPVDAEVAPSTFTGMVDVDGEPMAAYSLEFAL
ncbi:MAG: hypothetical protein HIU89_18320 [Proteobacteria bacterium]|nr:hypothetical protein [Pseudomonadota bacterium]